MNVGGRWRVQASTGILRAPLPISAHRAATPFHLHADHVPADAGDPLSPGGSWLALSANTSSAGASVSASSTPRASSDSIWIHAVSMGEVNAALPLIDGLMQRYKDAPFVITTVTPTGSERVRRVYGDRVVQSLSAVRHCRPRSGAFSIACEPRIAVIMETEIWPNLFFECAARDIPLIVANARLSEKSLRGYGPVRPLAKQRARQRPLSSPRSRSSMRRASRSRRAEPDRLGVIGNLKYDMTVPTGIARGSA